MIRSKLHSPAIAGYEETISPYYAASRLWLDAVIDPLDTRIPLRRDRLWISLGIEAEAGKQRGSSTWGSCRHETQACALDLL